MWNLFHAEVLGPEGLGLHEYNSRQQKLSWGSAIFEPRLYLTLRSFIYLLFLIRKVILEFID